MTVTAQALSGIKDAGDIAFKDLTNGKQALYMDYANTFKFDLTTDSVSSKGKGVNRVDFALPTEGELTIGCELINFDLFAMIMGSTLLSGQVDYFKREVFTLKSGDEVVTISETAKDNKVSVYKIREDGATHLGQLSEASCSGKSVTCTGGIEGDKVAVYYLYEKEGRYFNIKGTPENTKYYEINAIVRMKSSENGADSFMELDIKKASVQNSISIEFSAENPSSFEIKLKLLADGNNDLVTGKEVA